MNIGIIGSGGREHALCFKLKQSKIIDKIYCIPGNAGTNLIAENIEIQINDFEKIKKTSIEKKIELLVVGPEKPLVEGISDYFKDTNIKIFGPNKIASKLEGSKIFTKKLCKKYNIPTSKFDIFENKDSAKKFLNNSIFPLVIKADGLAAGKGVYICNTSSEALTAVDEIFDGRFGKADFILIEEFLKGEEMSYFIITDGKTFKPFQTAQDHKRVGEGDVGKNTGGMGAYSPSRLINNELQKKIDEKIIKPTLKGLNNLNCDYVGFLYVGLMIINNEPYLIEFNVRMGDPECQTILPLLNSDLGKVINACCIKKLSSIEINWLNKKSLCIVLCSNGYPDKYDKDIKIENLNKIKLDENNLIFHAGTKLVNEDIVATGGRVLNIVNVSNNFSESKKQALNILKDINWTKGFYRKDIGFKVIS